MDGIQSDEITLYILKSEIPLGNVKNLIRFLSKMKSRLILLKLFHIDVHKKGWGVDCQWINVNF